MTFDRIEKVVGVRLPESARQYRAWWSNNPHNSVMTKVWLEAGFKSEQVDLESRRLVFTRIASAEGTSRLSEEQSAPGVAASTGRHPLIGALKGLIHVEPGVDLTSPADPDWGHHSWGE
jgi:hypothetical protein